MSFMIANDDVATQTGGGCKVRFANDYDIDEVTGTGECFSERFFSLRRN